MPDENQPSGLGESLGLRSGSSDSQPGSVPGSLAMKFGASDNKPKTQDFEQPAVNMALIRERERVILEHLRINTSTADKSEAGQAAIRAYIRDLIDKDEAPLSSLEGGILFQNVLDELFGFGPLSPLLKDPQVTDITVSGYSNVYAKRNGVFEKTSVAFENELHLKSIVDKILGSSGIHMDERSPIVQMHLPNGSAVNIIGSPVGMDGTVISIRCWSPRPLSMVNLVQNGTLAEPMAELLKAYIRAKVNIVISGLPGSGKNTLLSPLSAYMLPSDWVVSVEEEVGMRLPHENWTRLRTAQGGPDGSGKITVGDLIAKVVAMRPDRMVVGDCRGAEGLEFLQALNTGRRGDITRVIARSPKDCLRRFEGMIRTADPDMPKDFARELIADNLQVIVQTVQLSDGTYKVSEIAEVCPLQELTIPLRTMYLLETGRDDTGALRWRFLQTGERSQFV